MARYAETIDIDSRLQATGLPPLGATTKPTKTQTETWLDTESAKADARISSRYVVPVTGAQSLSIMKDLVRDLVAAEVFDTAFPESERNPFDKDRKEALAELKRIADGDTVLPDAPEASSSFALGVEHNIDTESTSKFEVGEIL